MSNIHKLRHRKDVYEEPSQWLAKLDRGLTRDEKAALKQWLASDPNHSARLVRVAQMWDRMDALSRLADLFPTPARQTPSFSRRAAAMAASLIVAISAAVWVFNSGDLNNQHRTAAIEAPRYMETAIGQQSTMSLPDGSQLMLNTDSKVTIMYDGYERKLILDRGEIHIKVTHDELRPLRVHARGKVFQAVGTAFNVELGKSDQIELIVTEGAVLVAENDRVDTQSANKTTVVSEEKPIIVSQGEQARINAPGQAVAEIVTEDIEAKLSWRAGAIVFRGETLSEALTEVERYVAVSFVIEDEELNMARIAGRFRTGDVAELLAALKDNFGINHYRIGQEKIVLTKSI